MADGTYNSGTLSVSNGDTTTHDPSTDDEKNILSAECRWQGVTNSTSGNIDYSQSTSKGKVLALDEGASTSLSVPNTPDSTTYSKNVVSGRTGSGTDGHVEIRDPNDGTVLAETDYYESNRWSCSFSNSSYTGGSVNLYHTSTTNTEDDEHFYGLQVRTYGSESITDANADGTVRSNSNSASTTISAEAYTEETLTVTYPSVPSNAIFSRCELEISASSPEVVRVWYESDVDADSNVEAIRNEDVLDQSTLSSNSFTDTYWEPSNLAGTTIDVTVAAEEFSIGPNDADFTVRAKTHYIEETTDPSVTGDVDGSYTGTLSDGEWSPWVTLSGLSGDVSNSFNHSISGSNEANFEFTYDWNYDFPTAQYQLRIQDGTNIKKVAIADTSDSLLNQDHIRCSINGTTYIIDAVDPTHDYAIDNVKIETQNGVFSPRYYDSV